MTRIHIVIEGEFRLDDRLKEAGDALLDNQSTASRGDAASGLPSLLCRIPCLYKSSLSLIGIVLLANVLDFDFRSVFGEYDVFLFHLPDTALSKLV